MLSTITNNCRRSSKRRNVDYKLHGITEQLALEPVDPERRPRETDNVVLAEDYPNLLEFNYRLTDVQLGVRLIGMHPNMGLIQFGLLGDVTYARFDELTFEMLKDGYVRTILDLHKMNPDAYFLAEMARARDVFRELMQTLPTPPKEVRTGTLVVHDKIHDNFGQLTCDVSLNTFYHHLKCVCANLKTRIFMHTNTP